MHPSFGVVGVELAPVPAPDGSPAHRAYSGDPVGLARAAAEAGADALWLSGPEGGGAVVADPIPLAAGLAAAGPGWVGVRVSLDDGRHPSMIARELTALDLVTDGRSVVALRAAAPTAADRLAEAVAIGRALFAVGPLSWPGPHYPVEGAVNRPGPRQAGGPPILVEPGPNQEPGGLRGALGQAAGVLVAGDAGTLSVWRRALDALPGPRPVLIWRGGLDGGADEVAAAVSRLADAGVDGLVLTGMGSLDPVRRALAGRVGEGR